MIEAELGNQLFSMAGSGLGGYFAGWGLGKVLKLVLKVVAGFMGLLFGLLVYLQSQEFIHIDWDEIERATTNTTNWLASSGVITDSTTNNGGLYHFISSMGVPVATGLGMGFFLGLTRGLRT